MPGAALYPVPASSMSLWAPSALGRLHVAARKSASPPSPFPWSFQPCEALFPRPGGHILANLRFGFDALDVGKTVSQHSLVEANRLENTGSLATLQCHSAATPSCAELLTRN